MRFRFIPHLATLVPLIAAMFVGSVRAAEPDSADLRYFRELVETRNYSLGQPVSPRVSPDGKSVIFLRGGARDPVLRLYEFSIAEVTDFLLPSEISLRRIIPFNPTHLLALSPVPAPLATTKILGGIAFL